jgi:DNA-binding response OmpR family regulator
MRALIIEDDDTIAEVLRIGLEGAGYVVDRASHGPEGLRLGSSMLYAVILLDVMLPGMGGIEVCRQLREEQVTTPILMLTAKGQVNDRVLGLDAGADDYLAKPFEFPELLARLRSLRRRDSLHRARQFRVADLEIDTASRRVTRAGALIQLTAREYSLLEALASHEGYPLTRTYIQDRVWNDESSFSNTVDAYVRLLRKKIDAGHDLKLIHTVHGHGYVMRAEPEAGA